MAFEGFSAGTLEFLRDLAEHNDRSWFAENRERYERDLLGPEREFVDAIGEAFASVDPRVQAVPSIDRSIFRINRDTRFSRDKSPYKDYADVWFWIGSDRKIAPGYFMRLVPEQVWIGGGAHRLTPEQLKRLHAAILDEQLGGRLATLLDELRGQGIEVGPPTRRRVPRGLDVDHPLAELFRYTDVHAIQKFSPAPAEFYGPEFVGWSMERFIEVRPLIDWLAEVLGE